MIINVGKNVIHYPTGNGKHTNYKNGDLGDCLLLFSPHLLGFEVGFIGFEPSTICKEISCH